MDKLIMEQMVRETTKPLIDKLRETKFERIIPCIENHHIIIGDLKGQCGSGGIFEGNPEQNYLSGPGMRLDEECFNENPEIFLLDTVVHEFAHIIQHVFYEEAEGTLGHNKLWRTIMVLLGAKYITAKSDNFTRKYKYKIKVWQYNCPSCGMDLWVSTRNKNKIEQHRGDGSNRTISCSHTFYKIDDFENSNLILVDSKLASDHV